MIDNLMPEYYTFYDLETFGISPLKDRIAQFAAIHTDKDFNIIDKIVIYCRQNIDYLPSIDAILVTGITPSLVEKKGLPENQFIEKVLDYLRYKPNTCVLGYNNIAFDDEFIRHTAYRNFYPPYNFNTYLNSRWDIFNLMKACIAWCPEGINWPLREDDPNLESLRLECLTVANNLPHEHAHDALSDVEATIAVTKLIKEKQPKMFQYLLKNRSKNNLLKEFFTLNFNKEYEPIMQKLTIIHSCFGMEKYRCGVVAPIILKGTKKLYSVIIDTPMDKLVSALDSYDMQDLDPSKNLRTEFGIVVLDLARCPPIATSKILTVRNRAERLNIDLELVDKNYDFVINNFDRIKEFVQRVINVESENIEYTYGNKTVDSEQTLYSQNFLFNQNYAKFIDEIHRQESLPNNMMNTNTLNIPSLLKNYQNLYSNVKDKEIIKDLLFRYKARNYPYLLDQYELQEWNSVVYNYMQENIEKFFGDAAEKCEKFSNEDENEKLQLINEVISFYKNKFKDS